MVQGGPLPVVNGVVTPLSGLLKMIQRFSSEIGGISSVYSPPSIPVTNEGLVWDSLLKMVHNPGGDDCILVGGRPTILRKFMAETHLKNHLHLKIRKKSPIYTPEN